MTEMVIAGAGVIVSACAYLAAKRTSEASVYAAILQILEQSDMRLRGLKDRDDMFAQTFGLLDMLSAYAVNDTSRRFIFFGRRSYLYLFIRTQLAERYALLKMSGKFEDDTQAVALHSLQYGFFREFHRREKAYFDRMEAEMRAFDEHAREMVRHP